MTYLEQYQSAIAQHGSIRAAARSLKMPESTMRVRMKKGLTELTAQAQSEFTFTSYRAPRPVIYDPLPDRSRFFITTTAQDSTKIHEDFWNCLKVYAEWLGDCELLVAGCTYNKTLFEDHDNRSAKVGYHPDIDNFITHERIRIGDEVDFCGEMNTLPTAVTPLSGFATYTRARWGIFPHVKVQLESIATMKNARAKQIMTTGAVTLPNYVRKKAGIKAMFHHIIGAVLVELRPDGSTYCRHLLATDMDNGSFYDLDRLITCTGVSIGHRTEAIVYGDIHHEKLGEELALATWGYSPKDRTLRMDKIKHKPLAEFLNPYHEFYHDLSDFSPRNHHNIGDAHFRFKMHVKNRNGDEQSDNVECALEGAADFLFAVKHRDRQAHVVESNHHEALTTWLRTADYRTDPENAIFFLRTQLWVYEQMADGVEGADVYEHSLKTLGAPDDVHFIGEDESFVLCDDIEFGMHGHRGANGSRGAPAAFSRIGMKSVTGHSHSPMIRDGAYVAGVSGKLDMGYNKGPSSWANAHIVVYANGKRAVLTFHRGRYHA